MHKRAGVRQRFLLAIFERWTMDLQVHSSNDPKAISAVVQEDQVG